MKYWRTALVVLLSFLATALLFRFMDSPLFHIQYFDKEILNFYVNYELSTILLSLAFLGILYGLAPRLRLGYLNLKHIEGVVKPVPLIGLKPKANEGWKIIGLTLGGIITLVTGLVVYLQTASSRGLTFRFFPEIPLILLMALMNSFTEEVIFRLSYTTIVANDQGSPRISEFLSALVFGGIHYFGIAPSGIAGALMAGFIGWFLAKSINETKGFFWAWAIHFAQDVVILFFLFMRNG